MIPITLAERNLVLDKNEISDNIMILDIGAGNTEAMCIPCIIRETCDCDSTITAVLTGADSTISNATVTVVKL